jgi:hypothetical protein
MTPKIWASIKAIQAISHQFRNGKQPSDGSNGCIANSLVSQYLASIRQPYTPLDHAGIEIKRMNRVRREKEKEEKEDFGAAHIICILGARNLRTA